jgi:transitional endoplasmic reticulum ATPase
LLAKACARESEANFIATKSSDLLSKWYGESEQQIARLFSRARQVAPTVIFFDQLEAIAPIRGAHAGSMTTDRVVSQLLAELDGVEQLSRVIVLGATNRIDLIDPSVLRPGRFGVHIPVGLPDAAGRAEILRIGLRIPNVDAGKSIEAIVKKIVPMTKGFSGARLRQLTDQAKRNAIKRTGFKEVATPTLQDVLVALKADKENKEGKK